MSDRGALQIPFDTRRNQARAADPAWSIWVSANAGSGKTFVLTRRVLRLLLSGVQPEAILCLTYTKAAAAEMRRRVADQLAEWAVMDEGALHKALVAIEGEAYPEVLLERARTLFARALETPGGLKIVTIHAFCESVLHRFPLEAGVPFDFSVIEDDERAGMLLAARESVLAQGIGVTGAVETLFETLSDDQIRTAIDAALGDGRKLRTVLTDPAGAKARLEKLVGAPRTRQEIETAVLADRLIGADDLRQLYAICPPKGGNRSLEDKLAALDPVAPSAAGWMRAFLTADETVPARFPVKAISNADPALADRLIAEAERLAELAQARRATDIVDRSHAVLDIVVAIEAQYRARKRARSLLDFDDLVEHLADLFANREAGDWVRYKLDAGIDHILVDESQDTNGEQWRVVKAIADDYFSGAGAVTRPRSLFAVGDQKQSIYSFQGAEPSLFGETGRLYQQLAADADMAFEPVPLHTSFRTLPEILAAVDLVSSHAAIQAALLEGEGVHHDTARTMRGGSVTLWPPLQQPASSMPGADWPTTPLETERTAPRQVAERIAGEIADWIRTERPLTGRGRAIRADDVLILVQSRGPLFHEIIRALRGRKLPTPGADRLGVSGHIAVLDLLALCDVLLNSADDLQLAALLRSPLFDVSDDDLIGLAQPRARGETLWTALQQSPMSACRQAYERLYRWRRELAFERPYEALAQVLYAEGGLKRFHARLGTEVDDVLAELLAMALDHEQSSQPSLQGFVVMMRQLQASIKRELPESGGGVRIMTVHGAKGLEAPVVILADAASKPNMRMVAKPVYIVAEAPGPMLIHASSQSGHVATTLPLKQAVDDNILAEYWRRLYVAMTRAEDELYVTGALTPGMDAGKQIEGSWYEAIERALRDDAEIRLGEDGTETALVYPRERVKPQPATGAPSPVPTPVSMLDLAVVPAPAIVPVVSPSQARGHVAPLVALDSLAEQARDADAARREGIALHALLQHLGRIEREQWDEVVPKALMALLPEHGDSHARIGAKARSILTRPDLALLFGPDSRAEVSFLVDGQRDGEDIRLAGRMDRLIIDESGVTVVDYKSDASVPDRPDAVPSAYVTQLGLYALVAGQLFPGRDVRAAILWTELESLMNLPPDMLAAGARGFTMR